MRNKSAKHRFKRGKTAVKRALIHRGTGTTSGARSTCCRTPPRAWRLDCGGRVGDCPPASTPSPGDWAPSTANRRTAYAAGQWARILRTAKALPYLLYSLGPNRDHHVAIAGTILPFDTPFWHTHFPPNGWGCKCRVRQISSRERERLLTDEATCNWPCLTIGSASRRWPTWRNELRKQIPNADIPVAVVPPKCTPKPARRDSGCCSCQPMVSPKPKRDIPTSSRTTCCAFSVF